jgi:chromosome segregation ATPase
MSLKNNSSIMTVESAELDKEKSELINRLMETERTLVLVASQNEDLEKQFSQEKQTLKSRLTETEKALVAINSEKEKLEKKTASLERKLRSSSPQILPPRPAQSDTSAELSRLQMSFLKEKKEMLGRQQGLEKMLLEALSLQDKKEKTPPKTALSTPNVNSSSTQQHISPADSMDSERRRSVDP